MKKNYSLFIIFICWTLFVKGHPFAGGNGTENNPYQITTAKELDSIRNYAAEPNLHFRIMNDIDLTDYINQYYPNGWIPIGDSLLTLHGGGHVISGLWFAGTGDKGLFLRLGKDALVDSLGIEACGNEIQIDGSGGLLAYENFGIIEFCYTKGTIKGVHRVGGMVGYNAGTVRNCYSWCDVEISYQYGGGLIGYNAGIVVNCYSKGKVTGQYTGGLIGVNTRLLGSGILNSISYCYFDSITSIQNEGIGVDQNAQSVNVFAKTTTKMMTRNTFDSSWDFKDVWKIKENIGYPVLKWQQDSQNPIVGEIQITGQEIICESVTSEYTAETGFLGYDWEISKDGVILSGIGTNRIEVYWKTAGDHKINLDAKKTISCDGGIYSKEINVKVSPKPSLTIQIEGDLSSGEVTLQAVTNVSDIVWSTGEKKDKIKVTERGEYWAEAKNINGCTLRDTIEVNVFSKPSMKIEIEGDVCNDKEIILRAKASGDQGITWSTGETGSMIKVTASGKYWAEITDIEGYSSRDTVEIQFFLKPSVTIQIEGDVCGGKEITLQSVTTAPDILWSTGETENRIKITQTGKYWVEATDKNGCKSKKDTTEIKFISKPEIKITKIGDPCRDNQIILHVESSVPNILWNTGETTQEITVNESGEYSVTAEDNGCFNSDKSYISFGSPELKIRQSGSLCGGNKITLSAETSASSVIWSIGKAGKQITINAPGIYWAEVMRINCRNRAEIEVIDFKPKLKIMQEGDLCLGSLVRLTAVSQSEDILWSTGETTIDIFAKEQGIYTVQAFSEDCSASETIILECKCELNFPNAFNPDGRGQTASFGPLESSLIVSYQMKIYDRWGKLIFESNDQKNRWDGTVDGRRAPIGAYVYITSYICLDETRFYEKQGTIMLIR